MFTEYLARWALTPDGEPITTPTSHLLPVRFRGLPAILKIATEPEEQFGGGLMPWWGGAGAARVYAHDGNALLLERAIETQSLANLARTGRDNDACRMLCQVAARLHTPRDNPPEVVLLTDWFRELWPAADKHGGTFALSAEAARALLEAPQEEVILHGDLHHGNILDFGERGWLAIDPKRLGGERGFDYANLFLNPDAETAQAPGRLARRASVVADAAGLDRTRLLRWVLAYAGLSAAWSLDAGDPPEDALRIAREAAAELGQQGV